LPLQHGNLQIQHANPSIFTPKADSNTSQPLNGNWNKPKQKKFFVAQVEFFSFF